MKIAIIFTGGTISMANNQGAGGDVPALKGEDILAKAPQLNKVADIVIDNFLQIPSPHMNPELMWKLRERVQDWISKPDIVGVVVTHGTDTMEETAFLLDITQDYQKPVVFTGAMRSGSQWGYDGPINLLDSLLVCQESSVKNMGVVIVNQGKIFSAQDVLKYHSTNLDSFVSLGVGPLGAIDDNRVFIYRTPLRKAPITPDMIETRVDLLRVVAGMDHRHIECSINTGAQALVLEAFGRGNVPPGILKGLKKAKDKKIPVVIVTRCVEGRVGPNYAYEGGGKDLEKYGVIFGGALSGQKARLKLMAILGITRDKGQIEKYFLEDIF